MKLSKETKELVAMEREKLIVRMSSTELSKDEWAELNERYKAFSEMLKSEKKIDWNVVLTVAAGCLQVLAILNFEKAGIVMSKAVNFVFRGGRA